MKRRFNITGSCNLQRDYMVKLDDRLKKIKENFVDYRSYFVINKGRQYGKTTTLRALAKYLMADYIVFSLDFQKLGTEDFVDAPTFHSVIFAGVYDIKNLKLKLRAESEHQYNSPWNIAANFDVDMSFSASQIAGMLKEYEADYHTGMNVQEMAGEIYQYTSGYPVLVSSICKYIDEKLVDGDRFEEPGSAWTKAGIEEAVKSILTDRMPLFESMIRHLDDYPEMKQMFQSMLFQGNEYTYNQDVKEISLASMFGYAVNHMGKVRVANRIFETRLYNYFLSEAELSGSQPTKEIANMARLDRSYFVHDGVLDMDTVMRRFVETFTDLYGEEDTKFVEEYGRKFFLLYLKPIINGTGNYYIEAQTRNERRTDVVVDYLGEQFIIELKIWRGNEYNERGERQLVDYLDYYHKDKGYLLSFNFNQKKEVGVKELKIGDKTIVEAVV